MSAYDIDIADVSVSIRMPSSIEVETEVPVDIVATTAPGINLDGLTVGIGSTIGELAGEVATLVNGEASTTLYTGRHEGSGQIVAFMGASFVNKLFDVVRPPNDITMANTFLVGDQLSDGVVSVDVDTDLFPDSGGQLDVPYVVSSDITVTGTPGEEKYLELGTLLTPNIEPIVQYPMNHVFVGGVVPDQYAQINGSASGGVSFGQDSRVGFDNSYGFDGEDDFVNVVGLDLFAFQNNVGVVFEAKPEAADGSFFNHIKSNQKVTIESGRVKYEIITSDNTFSIESDPIALDQWHQIAAHYKGDKILLQVDDRIYIAAATGNLVVSQLAASSFILGQNYKGRLNNFKLFDWSAPTLTVFEGGATQQTVTINSEGVALVTVNSTAKMGEVRDSAATRLVAETHRHHIMNVAFAALQEPDVFWDIPIAIPDILIPDEIIQGDVTLDYSAKEVLITIAEAHQYAQTLQSEFAIGFLLGLEGDASARKAGELVASILLLGDIRDAGKQLIYQLTDSENYNQVTHILANLGALTSVVY